MENELFGKTLRELRLKAGCSVPETSKHLIDLGVRASAKTIYGWERGHSLPNADTLLYLCEFYNVQDILQAFGYKSCDTKSQEDILLANYHSLNEEGQEKMLDYSEDLVSSGRYKKSDKLNLDSKEA
ncbi:helix-turn-helix domain-containing protein [Acutalibacter sp. 1XD8-36]|uniref:helix-turn-helix domain-containing protein n=1 Tax=Acutalibacter sp. 1XD8-36 TaxID=2320852 RepID=UPI0014136F67|nr:helix-turn-helix transcriptional regulator [Acutalibacter sp. 1XD8-36]NBJ90986.1 XRE family transcriptional regulator [Acutalibacter sp. 1XD8-36]